MIKGPPWAVDRYNHPEVDGIWVYKEYIMVLSEIIFYLFQDGHFVGFLSVPDRAVEWKPNKGAGLARRDFRLQGPAFRPQ